MPNPIHSSRDRARIRAWRNAHEHWMNVGYSYEMARVLASVKHGLNADVRQWAKFIMLRDTNLREEDML